jgi:DNA repair protein RadC
MSIKCWPVSERPRERLLNQGAAALSDAELLAIFLRTGSARHSAIDMARQMISQFGGLINLLNANQQDLLDCHGMGTAKVAHLMAALELGRRYVGQQLQQQSQLNEPALVKQYFAQQLRYEPREVFAAMFLDSQLRLIQFEKIFYGSMTQCSVHIREIIRLAMSHRAVNLIVAHNHPDAPASPSNADRQLTRQLAQACHLLEVHLFDLVIVGPDHILSFAEDVRR